MTKARVSLVYHVPPCGVVGKVCPVWCCSQTSFSALIMDASTSSACDAATLWAATGELGIVSMSGAGLGLFWSGAVAAVAAAATARDSAWTLLRRALAFSFWLRMLLRNICGHGLSGGNLQREQFVKTDDAMTQRHVRERGKNLFRCVVSGGVYIVE